MSEHPNVDALLSDESDRLADWPELRREVSLLLSKLEEQAERPRTLSPDIVAMDKAVAEFRELITEEQPERPGKLFPDSDAINQAVAELRELIADGKRTLAIVEGILERFAAMDELRLYIEPQGPIAVIVPLKSEPLHPLPPRDAP